VLPELLLPESGFSVEEPDEPVLGLLVVPELPAEEPLEPVSDGALVEPPIEPELPEDEPPIEPLEPVSEDEPELPEDFEELPFGMISICVTSSVLPDPEKLART
jgi:hypothetical protein